MKRTLMAAVATVVLTAVLATAMIQPANHIAKPSEVFVLTSKDVQTNSVELLNQPTNLLQNLEVRLVGKTSAEIEAIDESACEVQIVKNGVVVTEMDRGCCGVRDQTHTNYFAMTLLFRKYDQAKLAERTLRGE